MWSNLRDVAGKISSVVAPPLDEDDDDFDDDEEEEEDDEEDDYEEEKEDGEKYSTEDEYNNPTSLKHPQETTNNHNNNSGTPTFGFVGLITRAMDQTDRPLPVLNPETTTTTTKQQQQQRYGVDMLDALNDKEENDVTTTRRRSNNRQPPHIELQSDDEEEEEEINFDDNNNAATATLQHVPTARATTTKNSHTDTNHHHPSTVTNPPASCDANALLSQSFVESTTAITMRQMETDNDDNEPPMSPYQRRKHLPRDDSMDCNYNDDAFYHDTTVTDGSGSGGGGGGGNDPPISPANAAIIRKYYNNSNHLPPAISTTTSSSSPSQQRYQSSPIMITTTTTDATTTTTTIQSPPPLSTTTTEPPVKRFSLVRESGSVTPQRTTKKITIAAVPPMGWNNSDNNNNLHPPPLQFSPNGNDNGSSVPSDQQQQQQDHQFSSHVDLTTLISSRSLGSTPCGTEVLLSPLRDILHTEQQQQQKNNNEKWQQLQLQQQHYDEPTTTTTTTGTADTAPSQQQRQYVRGEVITTESNSVDNADNNNNNNSSSNIFAKPFPRDALLGSFSVPNDSDDIAQLIKEDEEPQQQQQHVNHLDDVVDSSNSQVDMATTTTDTNATKTLNRVDSGHLPASKQRRGSSSGSQTRRGKSSLPMISLESFDENDDVDNSNGDSSTSTCRHNALPPVEQGLPQMSVSENHQATSGAVQSETITSLELQCRELQTKLMNAQSLIVELQRQQQPELNHHGPTVAATDEYEQLMIQFQEKETRLLQAANEEHQNEIQIVRYEMTHQLAVLQQQLLDDRNRFKQEREELDNKINEYHTQLERLESQSRNDHVKKEKSVEQMEQQHIRALRKLEDKLAHNMALLDERENDSKRCKDTIKTLESKLSEQNKGVNEVEEEVTELHNENEILHDHIERLQAEAVDLRSTISKLEGDSDKLAHLKMELRMLKEDHSREKAKIQTVAASAESSTVQLESERDEALAKVQDLEIQLSAAVADFDVAKSDAGRIIQANANLQSALEAFQSERDAEMAMMEENQREREKVLAAKHAAILDATHEANQAETRQLQQASDAALMNSMEEIRKMEEKLETYRLESIQTRRSLDEAIKRLQATQDDVIDRTFMKNILLDWLTKSDRKEKVQVLELMASVLHFTDAEKEKVHIDDGHGGSFRKLVIPPPAKVDLETLEGENVREKWVNFLIAEADD